MSQRMSDRLETWSGWGLLLVTSACCVIGCLDDVEIPDCVAYGFPCGGGGASPGGAGSGGTSEGGSSNGGSSNGGSSNGGSSSGSESTVSAGGEHEQGGAGGFGANDTGPGSGDCENCSILPKELVAPCANQPYEAVLNVSGGVPPFQWQLDPAVTGWSIAADSSVGSRARLLADAAATGETAVTVTAIDARGLKVQIEYKTTARQTCWFAYTASAPGGGAELALLDPFTEPAAPLELAHNTHVYDFQFSPDGRFIAYRYGADSAFPHGRHLALVELSSLEEHSLAFTEDAVTAYAWSPDASILAVGFVSGTSKLLGGARMPASGSHASPIMLASSAALVEDNLTWVGNGAVAYSAELYPDPENPGQFLPNDDQLRTPLYARLEASGFGATQFSIKPFFPEAQLRPARSGFWMLDVLSSFFPMTGNPADAVNHWDLTLLSPSRDHGAALGGDVLEVFAAEQGVPSITSAPGESCPMALAWSRQDKIACVADVDSGAATGVHGEVRFFDLVPGSNQLTMSTLGGFCTDQTDETCTRAGRKYSYGVIEATGAPRAFSPLGHWFAFTRALGPDTYVYWAKLDNDEAPEVVGVLASAGAPNRLIFSPDDSQLAVQLGTTLLTQALGGSSPEMWVTTRLADVDACAEELPTAPDAHCGDTALDASFKWAPSSKALAYRASGVVTVVDTSHAAELVSFPLPAACEAPLCSGGFEFQPAP